MNFYISRRIHSCPFHNRCTDNCIFIEQINVYCIRGHYTIHTYKITVCISVFSTFVDRYLDNMNDEQLRMYDFIINKPTSDWDIYYWMIGKQISIIYSEITVMVFKIYQTIFICFRPPVLVGDLFMIPTSSPSQSQFN